MATGMALWRDPTASPLGQQAAKAWRWMLLLRPAYFFFGRSVFPTPNRQLITLPRSHPTSMSIKFVLRVLNAAANLEIEGKITGFARWLKILANRFEGLGREFCR